MPPMTGADMLDAIALLRAYLRRDQDAQRVILDNGSTPAILTAVTSILVGIVARTPEQEPDLDTYLAGLADRWLNLLTQP